MKKTAAAVARITAIFTVLSLFFALMGCIAPENRPVADTRGAYGDAKSQYERFGMKAMWISYIEFQQVDFSSEKSFTDDIYRMFNDCKDMGLNTVIVHVRPFGDAFYKSDIFPWSHIITGTQGTDPGYDPLELMVAIAHDIGLRIEAWVNPYRAKLYSHPKAFSENNPANDSALTITLDSGVYYNPALPRVRDLVTAGVAEIVNNYDVDGIHFDDYFYPSTDESIDARHYAAYSGNLSLDDWCRENVNMLVRQVYTAIKEADRDVVFGISPQGNDDNNYHMQYSDVGLWLGEEGYCDYIMPQLYWGFDYRTKSGSDRFAFKELSYEWSQYKKAEGVKLYIGLGAYRIGAGDGGYNDQAEWQSGENLARMAQVVNANPGLDGWAIYNYISLFGESEYPDLQKAEIENIRKLTYG
ncbi:MAG: family 10 glycosylhydrolase [Oscillospiraceae bacterium]|nr:family 10 glycosylhydrolase [Oscillospiraceae bacterium]